MSALADDIVRRLAAAADGDLAIAGSVVKFDAGEDGKIVIDATTTPATVSTADKPADCTIKMAAPFLRMILTGESTCGSAYLRFVRAVEGRQALAVLVQPLLRRAAANNTSP